MSEIEKMYENAGVNKVCNTCELRGFKRLCPTKELCVRTNPSFTSEKQIELIKWLALRDCITIVAYIGGIYSSEHDKYNVSECSLESCLARLINNLWRSLTDKEKQQVKGILE